MTSALDPAHPPEFDEDWIAAQLAKAPPMSERQIRATSALLFGTTNSGATP